MTLLPDLGHVIDAGRGAHLLALGPRARGRGRLANLEAQRGGHGHVVPVDDEQAPALVPIRTDERVDLCNLLVLSPGLAGRGRVRRGSDGRFALF